jgi:hypothetical protein
MEIKKRGPLPRRARDGRTVREIVEAGGRAGKLAPEIWKEVLELAPRGISIGRVRSILQEERRAGRQKKSPHAGPAIGSGYIH